MLDDLFHVCLVLPLPSHKADRSAFLFSGGGKEIEYDPHKTRLDNDDDCWTNTDEDRLLNKNAASPTGLLVIHLFALHDLNISDIPLTYHDDMLISITVSVGIIKKCTAKQVCMSVCINSHITIYKM